MRILVVNPGSSTLKLRLVGPDDAVIADQLIDRWDGGAVDAVPQLLDAEAVGYRVVHGGPGHAGPARLTPAVVAEIESLTALAPLHQPRALAAIRAVAAAVRRDVPAVACFDTSFHLALPPAAATYALPRDWVQRWGLRRYGFHGLSHAYASRRAAELVPDARRMVTCHLGAGASLCAVYDGCSVDTTMGFTPVEGLVMATRSGTVDPGLVAWLVAEAGLAPADVARALEQRSGLAALAGVPGGDLRDVQSRADAGDAEAQRALDVYVHRLRREIAAMTAALGGIDVLVFTGGVGEHAPRVRAAACDGLGYLGVALDVDRNAAATADGDVSDTSAPVRTLVVTAREDLEIARQVRRVIG